MPLKRSMDSTGNASAFAKARTAATLNRWTPKKWAGRSPALWGVFPIPDHLEPPSIQSGLYFGTMGQVKEIGGRIINEAFEGKKPRIIGTGGIASMFTTAGIFDEENPDLVLHGLHQALKMNM